jgi:hypothetical protein
MKLGLKLGLRLRWISVVGILGVALVAGPTIVAADASGEGPVTRALLASFEKDFLVRMKAAWKVDTALFIDPPRAFYVDRFGVVMTSVVTLGPGFGIGIFRGAPEPPELADYRGKVLQRLPLLRQQMRDTLLESAPLFRTLKENDRLAVAVSVYHFEPEDTHGIPSQVVIQGAYKALLEAKQRPAGASLDDVFEVEELN